MRTIEIDNLILVEVPKDAKHFTLIESHNYFKSPRIEHSIGGFDLDRKFGYEIIGPIETPNLNFNFDANNIKIPCTISCNQSDFRKGGKCDKNGCLGDNNSLLKTRIQRKIQDAGLYLVNTMSNPFTTKQIGENYQTNTYIAEWQFKERLTIKGNLLLIKKLK